MTNFKIDLTEPQPHGSAEPGDGVLRFIESPQQTAERERFNEAFTRAAEELSSAEQIARIHDAFLAHGGNFDLAAAALGDDDACILEAILAAANADMVLAAIERETSR